MDRISLRAHAKLNLALAVGAPVDAPGEPSDGFHPICSYMHAIELHDTVEIERAQHRGRTRFDIAWSRGDGVTEPVGWLQEQDLVVKAYKELHNRTGENMRCSIRVRKSIPAGGGLGGGSSDAAGVLLGLNELFALGLGRDELVAIAMTLGSDIAFFLDPGHAPPRPAIVTGFGEGIERQDARRDGTEVTLIFPPFACATGAVYNAFDSICERGAPDEGPARALGDPCADAEGLIMNDLFGAACAVTGELRSLHEGLAGALARAVHLSGSGSTMFVLGRVDERRVHEVAPDCRVVHTRLC